MANANLFQQYLHPVKSVQDYTNEMAQSEGNQLELAAKRQGMQDDMATRAAFQASGGDQANALQRLTQGGQYKAAQALQKSMLDAQKSQSDIGLATAHAKNFESTSKKTDQEVKFAAAVDHAKALNYVKSPQDVISYFDQGIAKGVFSADQRDQMIAQANQYTTLDEWKKAEMNASIPVLKQFETDAENSRNAANNKTSRDNNQATVGATLAGQKSTAATAAAGRAQAERHFGISQDNAKGQIVQTDNGPVLVNTRTGTGKIVSGPDGQALPGITKPLNDSQSKALLFGTRMQEANKALNQLSSEGTDTSIIGSQAPLVGGLVNAASSGNRQMLNQAKLDFMTAVLRRESGAAISSGEYQNADRQYFPQVGDSEKVKAQKTRNRELAINGILSEVPEKQRSSITPKPTGGGFKYLGTE
jgi:hypothetical protein